MNSNNDALFNYFKEGEYEQIIDTCLSNEVVELTAYSINLLGMSLLLSGNDENYSSFLALNVSEDLLIYKDFYIAGWIYNYDRSKAIELFKKVGNEVSERGHLIEGKSCSWLRGGSSFYVEKNYNHIFDALECKYLGASPKKNNVIIATSDSEYFDSYSSGLIESYVSYGSVSSELLVAVVNPNELLLEYLNKNIKSYNEKGVYFITLKGDNNKWFFAFSRFLVADWISRDFFRKMFIIDIDCIFNSAPDVIFDELSTIDVGFKEKKTGLPWQRIQAGRLFINSTSTGGAFLTQLVANIKKSYTNEIDQWFLDQNILEQTRHEFTEKFYQLKFLNLNKVKHLRDVVFAPAGFKKKTIKGSIGVSTSDCINYFYFKRDYKSLSRLVDSGAVNFNLLSKWTLYRIGLMYKNEKKFSKALPVFELCVKKYPGFKDAIDNLLKIEKCL
ncbi:hypothetical protein [Halomonas sp. HAL1]|uniref:hypothetical protein n=1 Tax=Halomonas sp. HAL1 TaxID=550984 RepID=UPI00022D3252|nr:hypothetical protein [Halomonas sp. HAL1]EHA13544.1 hypothetical protein HAL1_20772 [Halomonas sp. HAL1]WKV94282.1 hypothetical protein Q3Y66_06580 [Halomonas sp. HAL1]